MYPDVEVLVQPLNPDDAAEDGLRQGDVGVGVNVVAVATKIVRLFNSNGHKKFLKIWDFWELNQALLKLLEIVQSVCRETTEYML